ncbi:P-protein [Termitomyces sp. T112]|nr:P-protein [Termitomyces sp. T112]KAH0590619.1 hypothetical protein H2248_000751 [Termitomyces sp. 'cryptogamus']
MFTVSVLGPLGTYTHEAAYKLFGANALSLDSPIPAIFNSLSIADLGLVPQENSIFGSVVETYDSLRNIGFVRGEITLAVQHCLLVKPGVKLHDIEKILSHEQALGQCSDFIRVHFPHASLVKTSSTAAAARCLLENPPNCAAICSRVCAILFGLTILSEGIQNEAANFTRFYLIARDQDVTIPEAAYEKDSNRGLVRVSLEASRSPSQTISKILAILDMEVLRIDRRPSLQSNFSNIYFVEIQANPVQQGREIWLFNASQAVQRIEGAGGDAQLIGLW